jgi:hypothetical protein
MADRRDIVFHFEGDTKDLESALRSLGKTGKKTTKDVEEIGTGLKGATKDFGTWAKKGSFSLKKVKFDARALKKTMLGVAAALAATAVAIGKVTKSQVDFADGLGKTSEQLGISVEALSALSYQAKFAGVTQEELQNSLRGLGKVIFESVQNPTSDAARIFEGLRIELKDSEDQVRSTEDVLADLADAYQKMPEGPAKVAISMRLMEEAGTKMALVLNDGSEGMRRAKDEARALGLVLSDEDAKAAAEFKDSMEKLKVHLGAFFKVAVDSWLPTLQKMSEAFEDLALGIRHAFGEGTIPTEGEGIAGEIWDAAAAVSAARARVDKWTAKIEKERPWASDEYIKELEGYLKVAKENHRVAEFTVVALMQQKEELAQIAKNAEGVGGEEGLDLIDPAELRRVDELTSKVDALRGSLLTGADAIRARYNATHDLLVSWGVATEQWEEVANLNTQAVLQMRAELAALDKEDRARRQAAAKAARDANKARLAEIQRYTDEVKKSFEDQWVDRLDGIEAVDAAEQLAIGRAEERAQDLIDTKARTASEIAEIENALALDLLRIRDEFGDRRKEALDLIKEEEKEAADSVAESWREAMEGVRKDFDDSADFASKMAGSIDRLFSEIAANAQASMSETASRLAELDRMIEEDHRQSVQSFLEAERDATAERLGDQKAGAMAIWAIQKALGLSEIAISTAQAAMASLVSGGGTTPIGLGMMAAALTIGGIQMATVAAQPPPTFHAGGMVSLGAPDEISARLLRSEAVLSPQGVRAAGGSDGVRQLNRGGTSSAPIVTVFKVRSRTVDAMVSDNLRTKQGPLVDALRAAQPRALGRHNPYSGT